MEKEFNYRFATVEQLHVAAKEKSLHSIRLTGVVTLQNRMYDTWTFCYTDRKDEILYVGRGPEMERTEE